MTGSCDTPRPSMDRVCPGETPFKQLQGLGPQAEQSRPANAHLQSPTGPSLRHQHVSSLVLWGPEEAQPPHLSSRNSRAVRGKVT